MAVASMFAKQDESLVAVFGASGFSPNSLCMSFSVRIRFLGVNVSHDTARWVHAALAWRLEVNGAERPQEPAPIRASALGLLERGGDDHQPLVTSLLSLGWAWRRARWRRRWSGKADGGGGEACRFWDHLVDDWAFHSGATHRLFWYDLDHGEFALIEERPMLTFFLPGLTAQQGRGLVSVEIAQQPIADEECASWALATPRPRSLASLCNVSGSRTLALVGGPDNAALKRTLVPLAASPQRSLARHVQAKACVCHATKSDLAVANVPEPTDTTNFCWACGNEGGSKYELCLEVNEVCVDTFGGKLDPPTS